MPGWSDVLAELNASLAYNNGQPDFDGVRRAHLAALHRLTGRSVVLYASDWLSPNPAGGEATAINLRDMQGLMEVFRGLPGPGLDLILHSPGGSPEAVDRLVRYMRSKYDDVRVFVPLAAMSAATMWSLAANRIVMGKHSQLGPIDPQIPIGGRLVPARALLQQFKRVQDECVQDARRLSAWVPTLQQYGPGLLEVCGDAERLAKLLVQEWVQTWMLAGRENAAEESASIATYFANAEEHLSHGRAIDRDRARDHGVEVDDLEDDPALQDAVLTVHHATMHTLSATGALKIIENHLGRAYVETQQVVQVQVPMPLVPAPPIGIPSVPPPGA